MFSYLYILRAYNNCAQVYEKELFFYFPFEIARADGLSSTRIFRLKISVMVHFLFLFYMNSYKEERERGVTVQYKAKELYSIQ